MFERLHHQHIAVLLGMLDAPLLQQCHCLFGGGTAMALRYGEYRESVDVDFLVSDESGYRQLRQRVRDRDGIDALFRGDAPGRVSRHEVRMDHYGIRTRIGVADVSIKFEIVREARMTLDSPKAADRICGVATLTPVDMAAGKLLANSDRGLDDATFNRDLIDLAMMGPDRRVLASALLKAEAAYGRDIRRDFARSVERLRARPGWLAHCMQTLGMRMPAATLAQRLRNLERRLG